MSGVRAIDTTALDEWMRREGGHVHQGNVPGVMTTMTPNGPKAGQGGRLEMALKPATSFPIFIWKNHLGYPKNKTSEICGLKAGS
ncbi:unnamed protein product [Clonostachys rosea]|uniref:Uncharacterized protein n=1 Tax=Bionectria ochroleuca TaxID=29856 RepID=A0ABY6TSR1_BIOOC|nr:unnamed protein product [Clonostachys rosea]